MFNTAEHKKHHFQHTGCCYDNSVVEKLTQRELLIDDTSQHSAQQTRTAIFEYIEIFYNKQRRHSTLHSLRPAANQAIKKRKGG
ncbi:IS3 family transposase [Wolbachia endosymbiont of Armadillidium arcangelii]|uniref:IS3 family transposase n=1 Tax=Wolbachia endosymbiont of Armadillidium arcangelii TaxID=3158571 RepID=UPI0032EBCD83